MELDTLDTGPYAIPDVAEGTPGLVTLPSLKKASATISTIGL
jgi:hypothetical protein